MKTSQLLPSLEVSGLAIFEHELRKCRNYLEFGCGGSTVMAALKGCRRIFSVDTDPQWIEQVKTAAAECECSVNLLHCDLGSVEAWGQPATLDRIYHFHEYAFLPWKAARRVGGSPELVLIDGRFRVACFLVSLAFATPGTVILFDDYVGRDYYSIAASFCPITELHGRLAKFVVERPFDPLELMEAVAKYSIIRK